MFKIIPQLQTIYDTSCRKLLEAEAENVDDVSVEQPTEAAAYGTYDIAFNNYQYFEEALAKVNKKAEKYGVPPLKIKSKEKIEILKSDGNGDIAGNKKILVWRVQLEGQPVKINGWEFLASLEHSGGNNNVIRFVPGMEDKRVRTYLNASDKNCDFCHSQRDRNNTYLVKNIESGDLKQVGGQCLQKYIGDQARKLAKFAFSMSSIIDELSGDGDNEGGGGGGRSNPTVDARTALAAAFIAIEGHGYTPKSAQDKIPTVSYVGCGLFGWCGDELKKKYKEMFDLMQKPTETYLKQADYLIKWFHDLPEDKKSSPYMISVESVVSADMVTSRSLGLIVSLPATYHRFMNGIKERTQEKPSLHMGAVGGKIPSTKAKCVYAQYFDGNYGRYQIVKLIDDLGNVYTWFNTSKNALEKDITYQIVGTVKKHDEYQGKKQTVLTRVKATEVPETATK